MLNGHFYGNLIEQCFIAAKPISPWEIWMKFPTGNFQAHLDKGCLKYLVRTFLVSSQIWFKQGLGVDKQQVLPRQSWLWFMPTYGVTRIQCLNDCINDGWANYGVNYYCCTKMMLPCQTLLIRYIILLSIRNVHVFPPFTFIPDWNVCKEPNDTIYAFSNETSLRRHSWIESALN